jgi:C1A family cysteine protease
MKTTGVNLSTINVAGIFNPSLLGKYRWLPDPPDARDHLYQLNTALTLAPVVDLRQYCSPIEDQGNIGSCTGNAIAGQIELIHRKVNPSKGRDVSRLFIYYEERVLIGSVRYDSGAYIRDGIKVVNKKGAPLENLWPYNTSKFATKPPTPAYTDALKRTVTGYQRCTDFNAIKNAVAAGNPVTVGFTVYDSFEGAWADIPHGQTGSGMMPFPNTATEQVLGGHAVCIVGYNDTMPVAGRSPGRFIVRNSWGTSWADNGYFYMPYDVIKTTSMSSDFWLISAVKNP